MSSTASKYAQLRRESEARNREALEQIIPQRYFDNMPDGVPKINASAKALAAAKGYVEDLKKSTANLNSTSGNATDETAHDRGPGGAQGNTIKQSPQQSSFAPVSPTTPQKLKENAEYRYLKQAWERIKYNLQTRVEGEEISEEVKQMMNEANDALVDIIHKWEGDRAGDS